MPSTKERRVTENEQCEKCAASIAGIPIEYVTVTEPPWERLGWKCLVCHWWNWVEERPE